MGTTIDPAVLIIGFVQAIASNPDDVIVRTVKRGPDTVIVVRVSKKDVGRVIGANGRTARALRILLVAMRKTDSDCPSYSLDIEAHPDEL